MRFIVCAAVAAALVVAGCGGGGSGASSDGDSATKKVNMAAELKKPATLTFWTWVPNIEDEVKLFEQAHPNIKVKVVNVGQGHAVPEAAHPC